MVAEQTTELTGSILIVDDIPENLQLLSQMLEANGYRVRTVTNGKRALTSVSIDAPDLILLDIAMPEMNGYEVCKHLKQQEHTRDIPVIFISALDDALDKVRAFAVGGVDYISKPFHVEEVLARVHTHLSLLRSKQEVQQMNMRLQQTVQDLEQRNYEMTVINNLHGALQSARTVDDLLTLGIALLHELFPLQGVGIYLLDAPARTLELQASWGTAPDYAPTLALDECQVFSQPGQLPISSLMVNAAQTACSGQCPHELCCPDMPTLCVPLRASGEALGLLRLCCEPANQDKTLASWERLAIMVADLLALSLANMRLREDLRQQAIRDPLTGLFNRRYLDETLPRELQRATREQQPLGLILGDIDHFKLYNDTYGHDGGDELLRQVGAYLLQHTRAGDIACRYGGEEFVLILPGTLLEASYARAEELRTGLGHLSVEHLGLALPQVTMSFGVASFPYHAASAEELLSLADSALYQAKDLGRNRVVVAELSRNVNSSMHVHQALTRK
jgi:diguanylate cyclase (GGDEF)-like protein